MRAFIMLALAAAALAIPQRGGRGGGGGRGGRGRRPQVARQKADPQTIIRCMAENFGNNQTIKDCVDCFSVDMDFTTQTGLDTAKACATQYWPGGVKACTTEIAAMDPSNMETLETVVDCFDDRLEKANAERCLSEATSTKLEPQLTEATICVLDSWKYAFGVVKGFNRGGRRGRGGRSQGRRGKGKGMMMKMMVQAHCDAASNDDLAKTAECEQCFKDAMPAKSLSGRRPGRGRGGRGGRGRREADPAVLANVTACSRTHLSPLYDDCTALLEAGSDGKDIHTCYYKVLVGGIVGDCVEEENISAANPENLNTVVDCGIGAVYEWLQEKNPRAAKMMGKFLEKIGGRDDDDSMEV